MTKLWIAACFSACLTACSGIGPSTEDARARDLELAEYCDDLRRELDDNDISEFRKVWARGEYENTCLNTPAAPDMVNAPAIEGPQRPHNGLPGRG